MSKQHELPSAAAERAYKAGEQTMSIIEMAERVRDQNPGRDWDMRAGAFLWWMFWAKGRDSGEATPSFATVRDAMLQSGYTGRDELGDHFREEDAPIGAIHWYASISDGLNVGMAAIDLGPMGLITTGQGVDNRFGKSLGFISRAQMKLFYPAYLGWSLDYAGSDPLVADLVLFRGDAMGGAR